MPFCNSALQLKLLKIALLDCLFCHAYFAFTIWCCRLGIWSLTIFLAPQPGVYLIEKNEVPQLCLPPSYGSLKEAMTCSTFKTLHWASTPMPHTQSSSALYGPKCDICLVTFLVSGVPQTFSNAKNIM